MFRRIDRVGEGLTTQRWCGSAVGRGRVFARLLLAVSCESRFVYASPDRGGVFDVCAVLVVYEVGGAVEGVGPAGPVHDVVMKRAQEQTVGEVGGAALPPGDDMVDFAAVRGPVTAGEA